MHLKFVPADRDHGWYYADENGQVILAQGQPIPVSVASEIAECVNAGWRPWHGGTIPADAVGRVDTSCATAKSGRTGHPRMLFGGMFRRMPTWFSGAQPRAAIG